MARRRRHARVPVNHLIHISIRNGRLNYVHEPVKFSSSNPEDGPVVEADQDDTVTWALHKGTNFSVVFKGNTPLRVGGVDTSVFGGSVGANSQTGTVKPRSHTGSNRFPYVVTVTDGGGVITDDPDIVIT